MTGPSLPIPYRLLLLAHDEDGTCRVHRPSLGVGLAGAALAHLVIDGRAQVSRQRLYVDPIVQPCGDPALDLAFRLARRGPVDDYLRQAAPRMITPFTDVAVSVRLALRRERSRRMRRPEILYLPHPPTRQALIAEVRTATHSRFPPSAVTAVLCGLLAVLQLEGVLEIHAPASEIRAALLAQTGLQVASMIEIVNAVERTCLQLAHAAI